MAYSIEILDTRTDAFRKTGEGIICETDAETVGKFAAMKHLYDREDGVQPFCISLDDGDGNGVDEMFTDEAGFEAIVGHAPESPEYYAALDKHYWDMARAHPKGHSPSWREAKESFVMPA